MPRDETDLQVVTIARSPEFPRYWPDYQWYEVTEPGGFGPYCFTSSNRLLGGQTFADQRFPNVGDPVTYTATVRNRGTNPVQGTLNGTWTVDGSIRGVCGPEHQFGTGRVGPASCSRCPGAASRTRSPLPSTRSDARAANNRLVSDAMAVPLLTYVDRSFVESFRDEWSPAYPQATTDDVLDWLNSHMDRFNELFAAAGVRKRVHYGVLQVINDDVPDPPLDPATNPYGVFPFRYRTGVDGDLRLPGYYDPADDIDYGLLHEIAHQLGLIDIYQLNIDPSQNEVSHQGYRARQDLMNGVDHFLSPASALAMEHWLDDVHGYYGQYLYNIPQTMKLRLLDYHGQPLANAQVTMYQTGRATGQGQSDCGPAEGQRTDRRRRLLYVAQRGHRRKPGAARGHGRRVARQSVRLRRGRGHQRRVALQSRKGRRDRFRLAGHHRSQRGVLDRSRNGGRVRPAAGVGHARANAAARRHGGTGRRRMDGLGRRRDGVRDVRHGDEDCRQRFAALCHRRRF